MQLAVDDLDTEEHADLTRAARWDGALPGSNRHDVTGKGEVAIGSDLDK
jgi:hypothetical protein